jgi:VWFA-related protein
MMRKLILCIVLAAIALPVYAAKRVTVAQLEAMLNASKGKPDAEVAHNLSDLELTERLSSTLLLHWKASLPGEKSQEALLALSDESQFLDPPAAEIPATAAPDFAAQRQIMSLVVRYISKTLPQLPNIFATQEAAYFQDSPQVFAGTMQFSTTRQPLHLLGRSRATVRYSDGREVVEEEPADGKKADFAEQGLKARGEFGAILSLALLDAAQNKLVWGHWEQGATGLVAVFNYDVPQEKSHYEVDYCCVPDPGGKRMQPFHQMAGYHGQITVDPATGNILRLMLEAELKAGDPVSRAGILVEYAPVEIGGKIYICPEKSISLSKAQTTSFVKGLPPNNTIKAGQGLVVSLDSSQPPSSTLVLGPPRQFLNDVTYGGYHIFRTEAHVLTGNDAELASGPAPAKPASTEDTQPAPAAANSAEIEVAKNSVPAPSTAAAPIAPSLPETATAPAATSVPEQEINVAESSGLPDSPANPELPQPTGFTLKTASRLVDVGVVAYDKKGQPIKDLKPEDFEVYDNGQKQQLRFFTPAEEALGTASGPSAAAPTQPEFSNREPSDANKDGGRPESSATILLLDPSNMAFSDLTFARREALRFLKALPANERVGLYVMKSHSFQILAEESTDHTLLEEKLSRWLPSAQDLQNAQDEEQRNRQHFQEVHSIEDLLYVNGLFSNDPLAHALTLDPELRDWESNPGRDAMLILVGVARHLATLPGHKNLVWIASDNVLADWSDKSVSIGKGDKNIEPVTLHAQEAMNDAHVSVYPLDASQLEAAVIDAGIGTRNVELAVTTPIVMQLMILGPEFTAGETVNMDQSREFSPGRLTAAMQQDTHGIQGPIRHLADATGGRIFRRSGGIFPELNNVVQDGHAAYLLSFTPQGPADGQFHTITVKLSGKQRDVALHYRTGYLYAKEPASLKERFRQAVWLPADANQVVVTAQPAAMDSGLRVKIKIDTRDLALEQSSGRWTGKLDVFFVQRDDTQLHAQVEGQTLKLQLKDSTLKSLLASGLPLERTVQLKPSINSLRILVVDENSGRMGSVTIPASSLPAGAGI